MRLRFKPQVKYLGQKRNSATFSHLISGKNSERKYNFHEKVVKNLSFGANVAVNRTTLGELTF